MANPMSNRIKMVLEIIIIRAACIYLMSCKIQGAKSKDWMEYF